MINFMRNWIKAGFVFLALSGVYGCSPQEAQRISSEEVNAIVRKNYELSVDCIELKKRIKKVEGDYAEISEERDYQEKRANGLNASLSRRTAIGEGIISRKIIAAERDDERILELASKIARYEAVLTRNGFDIYSIADGSVDTNPTEFELMELRYQRDKILWEKRELGLEAGLEGAKKKNLVLELELESYRDYCQRVRVWVQENSAVQSRYSEAVRR